MARCAKQLVSIITLLRCKEYKDPAYVNLLVSLASVSRTIPGFALDVIWQALSDFMPLIRLLPVDGFQRYIEERGKIARVFLVALLPAL